MTTRRSIRATFVAIVSLLTTASGATPVLADNGVEVFLTVKAPAPVAKNQAPQIEATIIGGRKLSTEQITLVEPGAKVPHVARAITWRATTDTLAVALVFNGQEVWAGNDDYEPEDSPARYLGALKDLKRALEDAPFAGAGPRSKGVLISYADKAQVMIAMGPLTNINAGALGTQADYNKKFGTEMVDGIQLGLAQLRDVTASRKVLIVVGDGNDTNSDEARRLLEELGRQAAREKVETFAIIYKGQLSEATSAITTMIPNAVTVDNAKDIAMAFAALRSRMEDSYQVTFEGYDPKTGRGLSWDGASHDLVVMLDQDETAPVSLTLPAWTPPAQSGFPWWIAMACGGALLIVGIGFSLGRRRATTISSTPGGSAL